jgi:PHP family Zn ribbon phosphoesterase
MLSILCEEKLQPQPRTLFLTLTLLTSTLLTLTLKKLTFTKANNANHSPNPLQMTREINQITRETEETFQRKDFLRHESRRTLIILEMIRDKIGNYET